MLEPAIQDKRRWWSREDLILLALLGVLFFFPGLGQIPLFDRDEPRFASAAREMMARHDYIVPYFNGELRPDKPPLVYWLMDAAYAISGKCGELEARLPSAICGTLTLLVLYLMVAERFGRLTGLIAAMILGSCAMFVIESRLATADATMLFFTVTCMACAWQAWDAGAAPAGKTAHLPRADYLLDRGDGQRTLVLDHLPSATPRRMPPALALIFWVSLAGGALAKGVPLLFVLVPMLALSIATGTLAGQLRQWRVHLIITRTRIVVAVSIVAVVTALVASTIAASTPPELRWGSVIIGTLLVGMVLTPGLPGVGWRCITGGNWRWWKQLRPAWGIPLLIALIAAWVVPVLLREPALLTRMVNVHFLERSAGPLLKWLHISLPTGGGVGGNSPVASYAKPPGFYLLTVWVTFWPWSILLVPAAYHTFRRVRGKSAIAIDSRPYQFLIAWIIPMWILLELARGKLFHYTLPTFAAIAVLCADALVQGWHRLTDVFAAQWFAHARWAMLLIWCALAAAVLIGANRYLEPDLFWWCVPLAGGLLAAGAAGASAWNRPSWPFVTVLAWGAALLVAGTLVLPNIKPLRLGKIVGTRMVELHDAYPALHFAALGYEEPSLVFYQGDHIDMFAMLQMKIGADEYDQLSESDRKVYRQVGQNYVYTGSRDDVLLEKIPFAPDRPPTEQARYVIAIDDATLALMRKFTPNLRFYTLGHYMGLDTGNLKPVSVSLITNVLLPHEYVGPASAPATQSATQ